MNLPPFQCFRTLLARRKPGSEETTKNPEFSMEFEYMSQKLVTPCRMHQKAYL